MSSGEFRENFSHEWRSGVLARGHAQPFADHRHALDGVGASGSDDPHVERELLPAGEPADPGHIKMDLSLLRGVSLEVLLPFFQLGASEDDIPAGTGLLSFNHKDRCLVLIHDDSFNNAAVILFLIRSPDCAVGKQFRAGRPPFFRAQRDFLS